VKWHSHTASDAGKVRTSRGRFTAETLENRTLLASFVLQPIGSQVFAQDSGAEQAFLYGVFADSNGQQDLAFSATSTNSSVLTASVSGSVLTITPVAGQSGFARVQMGATDPTGRKVINTFRVLITAADTRSLDVLLGAGSPNSIRYVQSNGTAATVTLTGPGSAVLHFGGDNLARAGAALHGVNQELESVTLSDTTAATTLNVVGQKSGGNLPSFGNVSASGSLGRLIIHNATLEGDVSVDGALPSIDVDFAEVGAFSVGSGAVSIVGKSFVDENFASSSPVSAVKLLQWANSDNVPESFSAASVRSISVRGDFTPGLQLSGAGVTGRTLGTVHVPGAIGGTWKITGPSAPLNVGSTLFDFNGTFDSLPSISTRGNLTGTLTVPTIQSINVKGFIEGATINLTAPGATDVASINSRGLSFANIRAAGNIGDVRVKLIQFSSVFAGMADALVATTLPTQPSDFVAAASIKSIQVTGGVSANDFIGSTIAASSLGALNLGTVMTSNNGLQLGVAANSIGLLQFVASKKHVTLKNVPDADTLAAQLSAQNPTLGDMTVEIF
jgi:hypothetical protein